MWKVQNFIIQVKTEMKKVAWPTRAELRNSTLVVIASTIMLAIFIGICDLILSRLVNVIISGSF